MRSVDLNYNYIRRLAIFLKKENLQDLFTALVLMERYQLIDDIRVLKRSEILRASDKYPEYLKGEDTLINRRWLQWQRKK